MESVVGKDHTQFPGYGVEKNADFGNRDVQKGGGAWYWDEEALKNSLSPDKRQKYEKYKEEKFQENCWNPKCGHSFKEHMHITYTTNIVEKL